MTAAVKAMLDAARALKADNDARVRALDNELHQEYLKVVQTAQDLCPHAQVSNNSYTNHHNGNEEERYSCKLCNKSVDSNVYENRVKT